MTRARRLVVLGVLVGLGLLLGLALGPGGEALDSWLTGLATQEPLAGLARLRALAGLAAATLVSEDLTCLSAGALVAHGTLALVPAILACFVGILLGDVLLFLCGRWFGARLLAWAPVARYIDPARVAEAAHWLERRGGVVILASRFLPGARLPTYFASGALGTSLVRFTLWFTLAGLLWTPLVVGFAAGLGGGLARLEGLRGHAASALLGTLLAGWVALALAKSLATWRGRAAWRVRLRRLTRFEYWPIGVFYLPVFALVLARALRGRGLVFTAANPALPHGGFVGESKRAIHALLLAADAPLPRQVDLPAATALDERLALVGAFRRRTGLGLPLVVKPDAGQRGEGVRIAHDEAALARALEADEAVAVQEFVPGEEFGLFYARRPGKAVGEILSLTHKVLPVVVGDGQRSLERLILGDAEHLPMARVFLARPAQELARVPAAGERVPLGELGTHCRGARFLDGGAHASPALLAALEHIVARMPGFSFGRFDVRAPSAEVLESGRFTILELNGVTSEAGHLYDPRHGLLAAWRVLLGQWRLAYAIGAENERRGARVSRLGELRAALRAYRALAARRERPRGRDGDSGAEARRLMEARS